MAGRIPARDGPPNPPSVIGFRPPPGLADTGTTIPGSRFWPEQMMQATEEEDGHVLDLKHILAFAGQAEPVEKEQGSPSEASSNSVTQKIINSGAGIMAKAKALWPRGKSLPRVTSSSSSGTTGYPSNAPPSHGKERSPRRRWYAVWCHERSHKSDASPLRSQLQSVLGRHNAELVCQKTSCKFKLWLEGEPDGFYLLISDWRQLKPCMDIFAEADVPRPAAVILLCERANIYAKATAWNDTRPKMPFPVYMLKTEEESWQDQLDEICRAAVSKTTDQQRTQLAAAPAVGAEAGAWVGDSPPAVGSSLAIRSTTRFSL